MFTATPADYHPSNELSNNRVKDFDHAMELYLAEHEREFGPLQPWETPQERKCYEGLLATARHDVAKALTIYRGCEGDDEAADRLEAAGLEEFADALRTGEYCALAI